MNRIQIARRLVFFVLLTFAGSNRLSAQPPAPSSPLFADVSNVIVLRNGRVLTGIVRREPEHLQVTPSQQSMFRVPLKQVDFVAADMRAAYLHQSQRIKDDDVPARLRLIDWCLQNDLQAEAREQLAVVKFQAPDHERLDYVVKRIELAERQRMLARLNATTPSEPSPPVRTAATPAELKRFAKELPEGVVEQFTHVIQPMLINRCGAAACHGVQGETEYRLIRPSMSAVFSHRYTQRNLMATVKEIRKGELASSRWIGAATRPHAGLSEPLFGSREVEQLELLVAWARSVGPAPRELTPAEIAAAKLAAGRRTAHRDSAVQPAGFAAESSAEAESGTPTATPAPASDPFDPAAFNEPPEPQPDTPAANSDPPTKP